MNNSIECQNCILRSDIIDCYNALKAANEKIEELSYKRLCDKLTFEKRLRNYQQYGSVKLNLSNADFYEGLIRLSNDIKEREASRRKESIDKIREKVHGKRIMFVIPLGIVTGGGNVILNEAKALINIGCEVTILNLEEQRDEYLRNYGHFKVPTIFVEDFSETIRYANDYDIICATSWQTVFVADFVSLATKVKTAYYIQDYEPYFYEDRDSNEYKWATMSYTMVPDIVSLTKTMWNYNELLKNTGVEAKRLCPSVDTELFSPLKHSECGKVVISAMVRPQSKVRSPEMTMRILEHIYKRYGENVSIHIFGSDIRGDVDFYIDNCTDFEFTNHQRTTSAETARILGESDIFVDFSTYQAMGLTAIEAFIAGCAVVVTKYGGTSDYAVDGINSLVVDTLNEEECENALMRLIEDRELREKLSQEALVNGNRFWPERSASLLVDNVF